MNKTDKIIRCMQDAAAMGVGMTLRPDEADAIAQEYTHMKKLLEEERQVREQTEAVLADTDSKLMELSEQIAQAIQENERLINEAQRRGQVLLRLGVVSQ